MEQWKDVTKSSYREREFVARLVRANRRLKKQHLGNTQSVVVVQHGHESAAIGYWVEEANAYAIDVDGPAGIEALEAYQAAFAGMAARRGLTATQASDLIQRWTMGSYV